MMGTKIHKFLAEVVFSRRYVWLVYLGWIGLALFFIVNSVNKVSIPSVVVLVFLGLAALNNGIGGIRDKVVFTRSIRGRGRDAVKTGYIYLFFSILALLIISVVSFNV